jgi:hypothetical protein
MKRDIDLDGNSAALVHYERDNDEAEHYFTANRDLLIEEEIYHMETNFVEDDLLSAINDASAINFSDLFLALKGGDGPECLFALRSIRDEWIKKTAENTVDNS